MRQLFGPTPQHFLLSRYPRGYVHATSVILMDLRFMSWRLDSKRRAGHVCYSSMDIRNLPMVGVRCCYPWLRRVFMCLHPICEAMVALLGGMTVTTAMF